MDSNIFAVITTYGRTSTAVISDASNHPLYRRPANFEIDHDSKQTTPFENDLDPELGLYSEAVDRIVLTFDLPPRNQNGWRFGSNRSICDVQLKGSQSISKKHFYITVDERLQPILIDESRRGISVGYDGQILSIHENLREWVLALGPSCAREWREVVIDVTKNIQLEITFPNHNKNDLDYIANLQSFVQVAREAVPPLTSLQLHSTITTGVATPRFTNRGESQYITTSLIGKGAFSEVYKAIDRQTGSLFAMKQLNDPEKLSKEVDSMRAHPHKNIIAVIGLVESSLIMPYFPLGNLATAPMTEKAYVHALCGTLNGLSHLHSHGIIHRDVKAENILVDVRPFRVVLSDFGFAKQTSGTVSTFCGTPYAVAPEVLPSVEQVQNSDGQVTVQYVTAGYGMKADVWSLGVTFLRLIYNMPTAELRGKKIEEIRRFHGKTIEAVQDLEENDDMCADILQRMIVKQPEDRLDAKECLEVGRKNGLYQLNLEMEYEMVDKLLPEEVLRE